MSDIYLQIAETPTVVTLSAPVISGALSSTVTVANTVTVALDANSLSALENVTVTVGAAVTISNFPATQTVAGTVTIGSLQTIVQDSIINVGGNGGFPDYRLASAIYEGDGETAPQRFIAVGYANSIGDGKTVSDANPFPVRLLSTIGVQAVAGAARIGVVTIGGGTVTIGAGTAQIGSVTASISGTVPVSGTFWQSTQPVSLASTTVTVSSLPALAAGTAQIGSVTASISGTVPVSGTFYQATQPVSLASVPTHGVTLASTTVTVSSLPALAAGTNQIGSVTASISGTVPVSISSVTVGNSVTIGSIPAISGTVTANTFAVQGTAVTTSNFTSTTASTVLANNNATRRVLTIFNEGAGNLHICPGATCTTVAYQVRLSSGDYYEVPNHQTTVTHSAVFATAGTARVTEVY